MYRNYQLHQKEIYEEYTKGNKTKKYLSSKYFIGVKDISKIINKLSEVKNVREENSMEYI